MGEGNNESNAVAHGSIGFLVGWFMAKTVDMTLAGAMLGSGIIIGIIVSAIMFNINPDSLLLCAGVN